MRIGLGGLATTAVQLCVGWESQGGSSPPVFTPYCGRFSPEDVKEYESWLDSLQRNAQISRELDIIEEADL